MSHFTIVKTKIKCPQTLISALSKLDLVGIFYDAVLVNAYDERQSRFARNVVMVKHQTIPPQNQLKADIAYIKGEDDFYHLHADLWELSSHSGLPDNWSTMVVNEYALEIVRKIASSQGYQISEQVEDSSIIRVKLCV